MAAFGDPETQLAFSVNENRGVFALLLGSGLSRAAEIPTGWEITTDLIRRVATAQGVESQEDWAKWYVEVEGKEPNYSELLAQLAVTPAERRAILHSYIEPDEEDREENRKVPTKGHRAIARLIQQGYFRVVVTTNFDRLMENALREAGIEPTVVASSDALDGAEPLTHSACYLLKLHGDYKDARILNTDEELDAYPAAYNTLLDRIFDEHGLVVCGWSGEWDHALRAAIERASNRRYPMFWASRGELKGRGAELCSARKGIAVPISDADSFFERLAEQVETLDQSQRQNPTGVEMLVSRAKRYLASRDHTIKLADLIEGETDRIIARLNQDDMKAQGNFSPEEFQRRVSVYEGASEGLSKVSGLVGRWGDQSQIDLVVEAIKRLWDHAEDNSGGLVAFINIRAYAAVLAYQACGLGLVKAQNWTQLFRLMGVEFDARHEGVERMIDVVSPSLWKGDDRDLWNSLPEYERRYSPLSDHLADDVFSDWAPAFLGSNGSLVKDTLLLETLTAIRFTESTSIDQLRETLAEPDQNRNYVWTPIRRAGWDRTFRQRIAPRFENSEFVTALATAGFGRSDVDYIGLAIKNHNRAAARLHWGFGWR